MKKLSVLLLCLSFCFQIKAQSVSNTTFTTSNAGWFQVGKWTLGQRGSERVVISFYGGASAPQEVIIDVFKDWSTGFLMDVKGARNGYVEQIRITKDDTYYYLEAYFEKMIPDSGKGYLHLYNLGGKASGFTLNSGVLPVSTGSVFYETGDIQFKTLFNNTLDLRNKLLVSGNVGIGTVTPSAKLEVNGSISNVRGSGGIVTLYEENSSRGNRMILGADGKGAYIRSTYGNSGTDAITFRNSWGNTSMMIDKNDNVGIGTTTTGSHKLAVEGSIGAREIKVEGSGWSDFVFEREYELPTLKEVENHIKEKGHLRDIPSAKEVEKNGFYLGAMDAKLLQKIEELTLYTIQQEKEIKELKVLVKRLLEDKN